MILSNLQCMKKYRLVSYLQKSSSPRILKCLNCRNDPLYLAYIITLLFMRKKHTHPHLVNSFSHCQIHKRKCQAGKEISGKRLARRLNAQEQLLHLQRTSFQHPRGSTQSSTVPFLRHLTPSSGLHSHQIFLWLTYTRVGRRLHT